MLANDTYIQGVQFYLVVSDYDIDGDSHELVGRVTYDIESNSSLGVESAPVIFSADRPSITLSFKVECAKNYYSQDCSQFCNESCTCNSGFTGELCREIDDCLGVDCGGKGQCMDGVSNYTCLCDPGYTGRNCDVNIDECQVMTINCSGRGQCVDAANTFTCACDVGYTGERCEVDVNECEILNNTCGRHGQCVDKVAGYSCVCDPGFTGSICLDEAVGPTDELGADKTPNMTAVLGRIVGSLVVVILLLLLVVAAMALIIRTQKMEGEHH